MTLTNPHIIFKSIEGKIKAGVVDLPEEPDTVDGCDDTIEEQWDNYERKLKQALANGVDFKLDEDVETLFRAFKMCVSYTEPYKLPEGIEIIIRPYHARMEENNLHLEKFAFLSKPKDVFDTGARLPEQKEESQETLWKIVRNMLLCGHPDYVINSLKSKFTLTRKS